MKIQWWGATTASATIALLLQVWEIQRAENVRRTAELVDGLRVQSTLFAISEGGEMFWKQMKIK